MTMRLSLFFLPFLILISCAADISTGESDILTPIEIGSPDVPASSLSAEELSINTEALSLVNQQRAQGCRCGNTQMPAVPALSRQDVLVRTAIGHSQDMEQMNSMRHQGSDGSTSGDRVTRNGYRWRAVGENIARGHTSVAQVVQAWFDSPGHCRNLMSENFTQFGMGRSGFFWTQVFAKPF